ncbi:MAG TPA: hypothetical protein VMW15_09080 [Terracidiphilus sp.]|nr:hypothetical protein [Terracidiphilus sp.]
MSSKHFWCFAVATLLVISITTRQSRAATAGDACSYLTPAQISAALGATVDAGVYVTPTFKRTCTWTIKGGGGFVTLFLSDLKQYEAGRHPPISAVVITPVSGLGDGAYFNAVGDNVGLIVKKGNVSFKVAAYIHAAPLSRKQAVERALAPQVLAGF